MKGMAEGETAELLFAGVSSLPLLIENPQHPQAFLTAPVSLCSPLIVQNRVSW